VTQERREPLGRRDDPGRVALSSASDILTLGALRASDFSGLKAAVEAFGDGRAVEDAAIQGKIDRSGTWDEHGTELAILLDAQPIGVAQVVRCDRLLPNGVYEVGLVLFDEAKRGRGYGTRVLDLLLDMLFDTRAARRVSLTTDAENVAMRRCAEKAGLSFEGYARAMNEIEGRDADVAIYAIARSDRRNP
jgi:RimJ/RimL family protein N-acetyltransferase